MAETTKIAWCDATFNPWIGCAKVSPGCDNCYAERDFDHRKHVATWGPCEKRVRTSEANWKKPLAWNRKCEKEGRRKTVFSGSLCDVFDAEIPQQWRHDLFDLIAETPCLTWLLLTKRAHNMRLAMPLEPRKNVWISVTVCNQQEADENIPILLRTPAVGRFISVEPMIAPVRLRTTCLPTKFWPPLFSKRNSGFHDSPGGGIHWVICGGETGPNARPIHPHWIRSLRDQCLVSHLPFFFKQWGEFLPSTEAHKRGVIVGHQLHSFPWGQCQLQMARVGKESAGDLFDGEQYHEFPQGLKQESEVNND